MSSKANSEDLQALIHDGSVKEPEIYPEKPIDPNELSANVRKVLKSKYDV